MVDVGFVEYAVAEVPGSRFSRALEFGGLPEEQTRPYGAVDGDVTGIISDADIAQLAADLAPGSSSAILVWENRRWCGWLPRPSRRSKV